MLHFNGEQLKFVQNFQKGFFLTGCCLQPGCQGTSRLEAHRSDRRAPDVSRLSEFPDLLQPEMRFERLIRAEGQDQAVAAWDWRRGPVVDIPIGPGVVTQA